MPNYNYLMRLQHVLHWGILILFGLGAFHRPQAAQAAPLEQVSAYELIIAMNTLRVSYGLPALIEDPIVNAVAQSTAATMAANNMSWHIGDVRGRIAAAGYGSGGTVWATENFAVGSAGFGIDEIMAAWADPDHMRPAVNPAYCHVGAGAAQASNGRIYYILQAAYVSGQECGSVVSSPSGGTVQPGSIPNPVSQLIVPVKIATPDADGKIFLTARDGTGRLLGAARSVTDFAWCCYLADLVVEKERQRGGLGRVLLAETKRAVGPGCMVLLLSTPSAMGYYPRLGMERVPNGFLVRRDG